MKTSVKLLLGLCLVCLASSAVFAQSKTRKKRPASSTICGVASVPNGMVIVGHKPNPSCAQGIEMVVKRPAAKEIVCANSPVPDGYTVDEVQGSLACGPANALSNALSITRGSDFYGIRIGMTKFQVLDQFGSPADDTRGTKTNPGKGRTWTYRTNAKTTYVYFDDDYIVVDFDERWH